SLLQPEGRAVEREAVVTACDRERLAELPRAGAQGAHLLDAAAAALGLDPLGRLERADQRRLGHALRSADQIQTPVDSVGAVHVRMPGRTEHRLVPLRAAAVGVAGGIFLVV